MGTPSSSGTLVGYPSTSEDENEKIVEENKERPESERKEVADGKRVILGIKKLLATNSFLSAASFQETTKVLTEAAIKG